MCKYGQCKYGQCKYGQCKYGQCKYGQCKYGQCKYGQCKYGQCKYGQCKYGHCKYGHCKYGHCKYSSICKSLQQDTLFFSIAEELKELHIHLPPLPHMKRTFSQRVPSRATTYNNYTIQFHQINLNQTRKNKRTSTRCLKRDSHTLKHLKSRC